jgi:Mg2+/Co2+ transporter CorB
LLPILVLNLVNKVVATLCYTVLCRTLGELGEVGVQSGKVTRVVITKLAVSTRGEPQRKSAY